MIRGLNQFTSDYHDWHFSGSTLSIMVMNSGKRFVRRYTMAKFRFTNISSSVPCELCVKEGLFIEHMHTASQDQVILCKSQNDVSCTIYLETYCTIALYSLQQPNIYNHVHYLINATAPNKIFKNYLIWVI